MLFSNAVATFLTLTLVSASPIQRRDTATILNDISTISSDVATLQGDVEAFTGNLLQGLVLAAAEDSLNSKIESTTSDVEATPALDTADSTSVTDAINTLSPSVVTVLNDLASKASVAESAGFGSIVLTAVQGLETNTDNLFTALEAIVDSSDLAAVQADQSSIDTAFANAIAAFSA